jgi:hypothetical protein
MARWKRILFWFIASLVLAAIAASVLILCIDRSIKFYPGIARDLGGRERGDPRWTRAEVEAYLGGPPGDYTTVPYNLDAPAGFLEMFARDGRTRLMWISDEGCIMVSLDREGKVVSSGEVKVHLSRQPNWLDMLKRRFRLRYVPVAE